MVQLKSNLCNLFDNYNQIFIFDVETSGLDKSQDEIIELAIIELQKINEDIGIKEFDDFYIRLENRILPGIIIELTGITDTFLQEKGQPRSFIAQKVMEKFSRRNILMIAHNANFDMNFLLSMFWKEKCNFNLDNIDVIDTLTIFRDRHPYPHKLSNAITAYGLDKHTKNSHLAIDDAISTLFVFDAMCLEHTDICNYINIIGINPKYGINTKDKIPKLRYYEQPYNCNYRLYELAERLARGKQNE